MADKRVGRPTDRPKDGLTSFNLPSPVRQLPSASPQPVSTWESSKDSFQDGRDLSIWQQGRQVEADKTRPTHVLLPHVLVDGLLALVDLVRSRSRACRSGTVGCHDASVIETRSKGEKREERHTVGARDVPNQTGRNDATEDDVVDDAALLGGGPGLARTVGAKGDPDGWRWAREAKMGRARKIGKCELGARRNDARQEAPRVRGGGGEDDAGRAQARQGRQREVDSKVGTEVKEVSRWSWSSPSPLKREPDAKEREERRTSKSPQG